MKNLVRWLGRATTYDTMVGGAVCFLIAVVPIAAEVSWRWLLLTVPLGILMGIFTIVYATFIHSRLR